MRSAFDRCEVKISKYFDITFIKTVTSYSDSYCTQRPWRSRNWTIHPQFTSVIYTTLTCTVNVHFYLEADQCSSNPSCDVNAICTNVKASHKCTCKSGFYGDGKTCSAKGELCLVFSFGLKARIPTLLSTVVLVKPAENRRY